MGDILYDARGWRRWLWKSASARGVEADFASFFARWDRDYLVGVHLGARPYDEALRAFLASWPLTSSEVEGLIAEGNRVKARFAAELRPFDGTIETLRVLRRHDFSLAVLSDSESPGAELAARLAKIGLGGLFEFVLSSRDLGRVKPNPACYRAALALLRLSPDQVPFVGHDQDELEGAQAVGMPAIALRYEPGVQADVYLNSIHELPLALGCATERVWRDPRRFGAAPLHGHAERSEEAA